MVLAAPCCSPRMTAPDGPTSPADHEKNGKYDSISSFSPLNFNVGCRIDGGIASEHLETVETRSSRGIPTSLASTASPLRLWLLPVLPLLLLPLPVCGDVSGDAEQLFLYSNIRHLGRNPQRCCWQTAFEGFLSPFNSGHKMLVSL